MTDQRQVHGVVIAIAWIVAVITLGYMLPWAVAATRGKSNQAAIALINFLLGWTFVGWIVALVMACQAHQAAGIGGHTMVVVNQNLTNGAFSNPASPSSASPRGWNPAPPDDASYPPPPSPPVPPVADVGRHEAEGVYGGGDDREVAYSTSGWSEHTLGRIRERLQVARIEHQLVDGELVIDKRDEVSADAIVVGCTGDAVTSVVESTTEIAYDTTPWDAGTLAKVSATLEMRDIAYTFADGELVVDKLDELRADAVIADITAQTVNYVSAAPLPPPPRPTPQ